MATEKKQSCLNFWYPATVSVFIIAALFSLANYVFLKAQAGVIAWQVYPAFAIFIIAVFIGDWLIVKREYGSK